MSSKAAAPAPEGEKPKGKGKLIIIIVAVVVLLAAAGGAYFFLFKKPAGDEAEGTKDKAKVEKKHKAEPGKPPTFINLEPFTVNLTPENGEQFLQVVIGLKVDDAHEGDKLKAYTPKIRNDILLLLTTKKPSEISTRDGREQLAEEIKDAVNSIVGTPGHTDKKGKTSAAEGPVDEAIFTSFIIQ